MFMFIFKHGKFIKKASCEKCGCGFLYNTQKDVKVEYKRINAYESENLYEYVWCPECEEKVIIKYYNDKNK